MSTAQTVTRPGSLRWVSLALGTVMLLGLAFYSALQLERERLDTTERVAREYGRAIDDLTTGFLHFTLGDRQTGPWERTRGYVLVQQALRELEHSAGRLSGSEPLVSRFREEIRDFERLLTTENLDSGTLENEVDLHLALGRLRATADAMDVRLRAEQQQLNDRFDRNLNISIALGLLLTGAFGFLALRSGLIHRRLLGELADSESKFKGVVEQSIAGVAIIHDGIVTYANPRAGELLGYSVEQLVGRRLLDLVVERDVEASAQILANLAADPKASYAGTLVVRRADGAEIRLDLQANPVRIDGAPAVLGIVQDVSEKHRLETERLEALQLLESISDSSGDAVFVKDLQGRYTLFNAQAERISGRSASEVLGRDDFATYPPDVAAGVMAVDQSIMRDGKVRRVESQLPTPHGTRTLDVIKGPLYDRNGRIKGVFGVSRDMTERKAQEAALQESREELETVIDALDEGLVIYDPGGNVLRVNAAALRINGVEIGSIPVLSPVERRALLAFETLDGQAIPFEDWPAQRILRGETVRDFECVLVNERKQVRRTLNCNGALVRASDGTVRLGLLTYTDITERRQAQAALLQTQRLESLGTLAAGIAHDFNNVLLSITGNTSLADQELPPDHPAHVSLREVQRAGQRAKDLVRRILLFARAEESQRKTSDLRDIVGEAVDLMRPMLPARIQLLSTLPSAALPVYADASQIHQVIVNLITNAGHAIEDVGEDRRGQVAVSVEEAVFDAPLQFGARNLPAGRYARLVIRDDGCGMDASVLDRVFDPFFTTKQVGRGTGLGLSIVRSIIADHGGSVALTSAVGKGTRVEILLPRAGGALVEAPAKLESVSGEGRRVLYIDDEPALVSLVTRYLRRQGYEVTGSTDPQEALQAFAAHPDRYDLVVTDLSMPQMSGFEVARAVREQSANVPVIMMSGFVRPEDRDRAMALGVREVLLKPATVEELCQSINRQLH